MLYYILHQGFIQQRIEIKNPQFAESGNFQAEMN